MTDPTPAESLAYAESLGVNSVYADALAKHNELGTKMLDLSNLKNRRRQLETYRSDKEMEVLEDEQGKHRDQSATWLKEHMKIVYSNTDDIRETRDELMNLAGEIELLEFEIDLLNQDIRISIARLHELAGYLQFMSVIKNVDYLRKAEQDEQSRTQRNESDKGKDPWQ